MSDQRRLERYELPLPVTVTVNGASFETQIRDISAMGAYFFLDCCYDEIDTDVQIRLTMTSEQFPWLPEGRKAIELAAHGKLVRIDDDGAAVVFTERIVFSPLGEEPAD